MNLLGPPPEAFLFDLDGTLVDSERANVESVVLAVRRHGAELTEEERGFVIGHSWNEIYKMIARNHALTIPMRELIDQAVAEKDALLAKTGHRALPGAVALVQRLARRSKMAVVSGASGKEVRDALGGIGLRELFPVIVAAEDYANGKPSPEPYLTGLAQLGAAAARSIVIEDSTAGIRAARAAGMKVIGVRAGNFAAQRQEEADVVVDTLLEVTDTLVAGLFV